MEKRIQNEIIQQPDLVFRATFSRRKTTSPSTRKRKTNEKLNHHIKPSTWQRKNPIKTIQVVNETMQNLPSFFVYAFGSHFGNVLMAI